MRLHLSALVLSSALVLAAPVSAFADTDTFTVTGDGYTFSFDLPSSFAVNSADQFGAYNFQNVSVNYAGNAYAATATFFDAQDFAVYDMANFALSTAGEALYATSNGVSTFIPNTYNVTENINCVATLVMPSSRALPTLALFQMPSFGTVCNDSATVQIQSSGGPVSATPEPSSLLLFATGALGVAGIATRRLWS